MEYINDREFVITTARNKLCIDLRGYTLERPFIKTLICDDLENKDELTIERFLRYREVFQYEWDNRKPKENIDPKEILKKFQYRLF